MANASLRALRLAILVHLELELRPIRIPLLLSVFAILAACSAADPGPPQISIEQPWARATPEGAATAAVYAVIHNAGGADRLLSVETPASASTEVHRTEHENGMAQMRAVESLDIPARGQVVLQPSGLHLMLNGLHAQLVDGQRIPLGFVFEEAGRIDVEAQVVPIDALEAPGDAGADHSAHQH